MISQDPYADGAAIGWQIARRGYKNVVFISSKIYHREEFDYPGYWLKLRLRGIALGLGLGESEKVKLVESVEDSVSVCRKIKSEPGHTCVVSVNVKAGAEFIDFARNEGVNSPEDYELISFDDNPKFLKYNITALSAPFDRIGRTLGQMICNSSSSMQNNAHVWIKVPYELKERQTFKITGD